MSVQAEKGNGVESKKLGEGGLMIRFLIGLCAILAAAVIVAVVAIVVIGLEKRNEVTSPTSRPVKMNLSNVKVRDTVCQTPHCKMTANVIENLMNRNVRPCDDFYEFACGGWVKKTTIHPGLPMEFYSHRVNAVQNRTKEVLEEPANPQNLEALEKAKAFYKSCLDIDSIEKRGLKPLREAFRENGLAFPLLGIDDKNIPFEKTVASYKRAGLRSFLSISVINDYKKYEGKLFQLTLKDWRSFYGERDYNNPRLVALLKQYFLNLTAAISGKTFAEVNAAVEDIMKYEIGISKLLYGPGAAPLGKDSHKRLTLKELNRTFIDGFDITLAFFEIIKPMGIRITENDFVYIHDYQQMLRIGKYLAGFSDKRVLKNILGLVAVTTFLPYLPEKLRQMKNTLDLEYLGIKPMPRWELCVNNRLDYATTRLFADKYFPFQHKEHIERLSLMVKAAAKMMLTLNKWMDLPTLKEAYAKMENMKLDIAYPSWIFNDTELNHFYSNVTVLQSETLKTFIALERVRFVNKMHDYLTAEFNVWLLSPLSINAYPSQSLNKFYVLAGIIQPPFFDVEYPAAMNYGGIGYVVGHGISHNFDANARHRDKNGDFVDWWTNKSSENYEKRVSCIVDQYSGYVNEHINMTLLGNMTKDEDIADIMGLHMAFKAYRSWADHQGREENRLPGLEFTPNQLFFINYAHAWCGKGRTTTYFINHRTSRHSYWKFRVNGPVESYKGFVNAFNCPVGSPMNPGKKCELW